MEAITIKRLISEFRKDQTRCGIKKMYEDLKVQLEDNNIKMGRDGLFDFALQNDLLIKKTKLYHITTDSKHGYYKSPNLIKDLFPTRAEQVLVSDITYIRIENDWAYLALVTDLYSKKIMGYCIADNMKTPMVLQALKMALKNCVHNRKNMTHHSDRGIQYEEILNNFYVRRPDQSAIEEFNNYIQGLAKNTFNDSNKIMRPNEVEVVLSFSITEKRYKTVDVGNLAKAVLDSLNNIAFEDDSQVASLISIKHIHPLM